MRYLIYLFLFLLISCNRGCTYRKVIQTAEKNIWVDINKIHIQVDKVKATTRFFYFEDNSRKETFLKSRTNVDYQFDVHITFNDRPRLMYAYYNAAAEKQSAKDYINKIVIKVNKRNDCFLIGEENEMVLYRMLEKGKPFTFYTKSEKNIYKDITYNIENELPARKIVLEALSMPHVTDIYHQTAINDLIDVLRTQEPASVYDFKALQNLTKNYVAQRLLDSIRISQNTKNLLWKNTALQSAKKLISDYNNNSIYGIELIYGLNDSLLFAYADSVAALTWPDENNYHYNQYLKKRFLHKQYAVKVSVINYLYNKTKNILNNYPAKNYSFIQWEDITYFLLVYKKQKELNTIIDILFSNEMYYNTVAYMDNIFQKHFYEFDTIQQEKIINKYKNIMIENPNYFLMEFLKDHISCEEFYRLKNKHPQELTNKPSDTCLHK